MTGMRIINRNGSVFGESLIGLDNVRNAVEAVLSHMSIQGIEELYERVFLFVGNCSCAKKTTAKLMADTLSERNILPGAHIVYKDADELSSKEKMAEAISVARGGVLYLENTISIKSRIPVLIDLIESEKHLVAIMECLPTDLNSLLKYDRRLREIVNSCSYNKVVFTGHYHPFDMKMILRKMAKDADYISEIRYNSSLSASSRYLDLSYKIFNALEKEKGIKCSSGEFLKCYLNDSIYKMLRRNGNSLSVRDIPDQYSKYIERVPYCISIDQIETGGRSLFAMDLQRSLLFIETSHGPGKPLESTGVIITANGYALISSHCLKGMDTVNATVFCPDWHGDYMRIPYECDICEPIDDNHNVAIIKLKKKGNESFSAASIRNTPIHVKEKCYIMGCPHGTNPFIYDGIVSSRQFEESGKEYYTCTANSYPGSLGSPIFGSDGRVLGLLAGKKVDPYDIDENGDSFFYPIAKILEIIVLERCEAGGPSLDISDDYLPYYWEK